MLVKTPYNCAQPLLGFCMSEERQLGTSHLFPSQPSSQNAITMEAHSQIAGSLSDENSSCKANMTDSGRLVLSKDVSLPSSGGMSRIDSISSADHQAELEASVSAKINAELFELATGKKEVKRGTPMIAAMDSKGSKSGMSLNEMAQLNQMSLGLQLDSNIPNAPGQEESRLYNPGFPSRHSAGVFPMTGNSSMPASPTISQKLIGHHVRQLSSSTSDLISLVSPARAESNSGAVLATSGPGRTSSNRNSQDSFTPFQGSSVLGSEHSRSSNNIKGYMSLQHDGSPRAESGLEKRTSRNLGPSSRQASRQLSLTSPGGDRTASGALANVSRQSSASSPLGNRQPSFSAFTAQRQASGGHSSAMRSLMDFEAPATLGSVRTKSNEAAAPTFKNPFMAAQAVGTPILGNAGLSGSASAASQRTGKQAVSSPFSATQTATSGAVSTGASPSKGSRSRPASAVTSPFSTAARAENPFVAAQSKPCNPFAAVQQAAPRVQGVFENAPATVLTIQPSNEAAAPVHSQASSPFAQSKSALVSPISSASRKASDAHNTPFEKTAFQAPPILREETVDEEEKADLVKIEAAKLSASISSCTRVPSAADVAKAIESHNSSLSDLSKHESDPERALSPTAMSVASRKGSRRPSLDTVNEHAERLISGLGLLQAGDADTVPRNKSRLSVENPSLARVRAHEEAANSSGDDSQLMRREGMKSMSILETEGIPQLQHELRMPTTSNSTSGSPGVRMNLANEARVARADSVHSLAATPAAPRVHGVSIRSHTVPSRMLLNALDEIEKETPFKGAQPLPTIASGAPYIDPPNDLHGDDDDMSRPESLRSAIADFKPDGSVIEPPILPAQSDESREEEEEAEWVIKYSDLKIGRPIGHGSYGEVYRAQWRQTDVAVKKMTNVTEEHMKDFQQEVALMARLKHPNVLQFLGCSVDLPNLSIVTQFMPRGSLFKLLHKSEVVLKIEQKLWIALDIAKGMYYLHTCKPPIVHGDVSSKNMLVDRDFTTRVADFGMSRQKRKEKLSASKAGGTAEWTAPEVLRGLPYSEKADVFSFGVILHELMTQQVPWAELTAFQVSNAVGWNHQRLDIPEDTDPRMQTLIRLCWEEDPEKRPSFDTIIDRLREIRSSIINARKSEAEAEKVAPAKVVSPGPQSKDKPNYDIAALGVDDESRRRSLDNLKKFEATQKEEKENQEREAKAQLRRAQSLGKRETL